jgi:hypothetical protein
MLASLKLCNEDGDGDYDELNIYWEVNLTVCYNYENVERKLHSLQNFWTTGTFNLNPPDHD